MRDNRDRSNCHYWDYTCYKISCSKWCQIFNCCYYSIVAILNKLYKSAWTVENAELLDYTRISFAHRWVDEWIYFLGLQTRCWNCNPLTVWLLSSWSVVYCILFNSIMVADSDSSSLPIDIHASKLLGLLLFPSFIS